MENIEFLGVTIVIDGNHENTEMDLGSITLSLDGREYKLDPTQSYRNFEHGLTNISVDVEVDKETFPDCKFDLEAVDLMDSNLDAKFYFSCDEDWEHATLFIKSNGCTKAIDLKLDY